jgi:PAS domain S-box-containing protein
MSPLTNFAQLFKHIPSIVLLFDDCFKICGASDFFLEHSGITPGQLEKMELVDFVYAAEREEIEKALMAFVESGEQATEFNFRTINLGKKVEYYRMQLCRTGENLDVCYMGVAHPLTDLKNEILNLKAEKVRYKKLEHIGNIGLWELDLVLNKLTWSSETYLIHKVPESEDLQIETAINFYHPDDRAKIQNAVQHCLENGEEYNLNLRIINRANEVIWVNTRGEPLKNKAGKIVKIYGTFQDITQTLADQKLAHTYQSILDSFAIVAKTDKFGEITYVNEQFCQISGYTRSELIGKHHSLLNSGVHPVEFWQNFWQTIQSGKTWRQDVCNRAKDGSLYWVDTFVSPLFDSNQNIDGFMAVRIEITEKKLLESQVEVERERATIHAQLASIGEMSAGIAHEINNPLSVLKGMADLLPRKVESKEGILSVQASLHRAIDRITKIVKGLKRLSHQSLNEKGDVALLSDIMNDTLDFCKEILSKKGVDIQVGEIPVAKVQCHPVQISQVLLNLINNARDAIALNDEKWIRVESTYDDESIFIKIIDSGHGIAPEIAQKMMEPFFTTKTVGKGTGLGLSLSLRIIKEHQGKLEYLADEPNTTFLIQLPRHK